MKRTKKKTSRPSTENIWSDGTDVLLDAILDDPRVGVRATDAADEEIAALRETLKARERELEAAKRERNDAVVPVADARLYGLKTAHACLVEQSTSERTAAQRALRFCERPDVSREEVYAQRVNILRRFAVADAYDMAAGLLKKEMSR